MKTIISIISCVAFSVLLSACSGMHPRDRDTVAGAVVGGALGSLMTGGSALGTVGGAAVGGVVGNSVDHAHR